MESNNTQPKEEEKKKRQVGEYIRVPIFDLDDGISVAKIVSNVGGGRLDVESVAKSMGYSTTTVMHHINSAKHYQLVETSNGMAKITDLGTGIVHPKSKEEYANSITKAFLSCDLYNRIYDRYKGKDLPQLEILANIFARDEGVSFKTKDRTVLNFIQSGIIVGLIKQENNVYHCAESIGKEKEAVEVVPERESIESPEAESKKIDNLREITETKEKTTKPVPSPGKIKIMAEPFFELFINPDEKAFDALIQLLPYYRAVYCKKNDDSLERIVS
ncbi:uncharacterized protein ig2599ANME_1343 [groundwater metagenome]